MPQICCIILIHLQLVCRTPFFFQHNVVVLLLPTVGCAINGGKAKFLFTIRIPE